MRRSLALLCIPVVWCLASGRAPAQAPVLADQVEKVWESPAELTFELQVLLEKGLMPILNHVPGEGRFGGRIPQLSLLDMNAGTLRWTIDTGSDVSSMTATDDGEVLLLTTAGIAAVEQAMVAAVSAADGAVLWQLPLEERLDCGGDLTPVFRQIRWFGDRWAKSQGIGGGVCVVGERVFLKVGENAFCLDAHSGEVLWQTPVGFSLAAPLTPCGKILLGAVMFRGLMAIDMETGESLWSTEIGGIARIYALGEGVYCSTGDGFFGRLDAETGEPLWQTEGGSTFIQFAFLVAGRIVLYTPTHTWIIDPETGTVEFSVETTDQGSTFSGDTLFYCPKAAEGEGHSVVAVRIADHERTWSVGLTAAPHSLHHVGETLLVVSMSEMQALRPSSGELYWSWPVPMGGGYIDENTIAADDTRIYFRAFSWLVGFETASGLGFLEAPGDFFFVGWMRLRGDNLCLHYGHQRVFQAVKLVHSDDEPPAGDGEAPPAGPEAGA